MSTKTESQTACQAHTLQQIFSRPTICADAEKLVPAPSATDAQSTGIVCLARKHQAPSRTYSVGGKECCHKVARSWQKQVAMYNYISASGKASPQQQQQQHLEHIDTRHSNPDSMQITRLRAIFGPGCSLHRASAHQVPALSISDRACCKERTE